MMRVIVTEVESCEDGREVLPPDGFVAAHRRGLGRLFDMRKVNGVPEVGHGNVGLLSHAALAVDLLHFSSGELLDRFAGPAVMLVVLLAEPLRPLHSLRLSVYNLSDVIANVKRTVSLEHMTALITSHRFSSCPTDKARIAVNATIMQRLFGNVC